MLHFFDISSHQPQINWGQVATESFEGVSIKATQGLGYQNPSFQQQAAGAAVIGLERNFYTYLDPTQGSGHDQALYLLAHVGPLPDDVTLAGDFEYGVNSGESLDPNADLGAFCVDFAQTIYGESGRWPWIYSGNYYLGPHNIAGQALLADCPLWLAALDRFPTVPKPWKTLAAWQYSWSGSIRGINVPCDLDVFGGDRAAWKLLGKH